MRGFEHEITALFLASIVINMLLMPVMAKILWMPTLTKILEVGSRIAAILQYDPAVVVLQRMVFCSQNMLPQRSGKIGRARFAISRSMPTACLGECRRHSWSLPTACLGAYRRDISMGACPWHVCIGACQRHVWEHGDGISARQHADGQWRGPVLARRAVSHASRQDLFRCNPSNLFSLCVRMRQK